jgi:hypothetical protein
MSPNNSLIQLDFFDKLEDARPLPLIVAEKWNFPLDYRDIDGNPDRYIYQAREWYLGHGGLKQNWSSRKADWLYDLLPVMIEVKRPRRKPEMLEYVDARGLYSISQHMTPSPDRPQLKEIQDYLSHAGVWVDQARRNPAQAAYQLENTADKRYAQRLQEFGYTKEQIPALLVERKEDVAVRNLFTDMLQSSIDGMPQYAAITNAEYSMFHRTAEQIGNQLGTKNVREAMHPLAKDFCRIAEKSCMEKVKQLGRKLTNHEAHGMMYGIAQSLGVTIDWLQKQIGIDIVTGRPLLAKWTMDNHD